jgi:hypothetical protein
MQEFLFVSSEVFSNIWKHHLGTFRHLSLEDHLALTNEILIYDCRVKQNSDVLEDELESLFFLVFQNVG